MKNRLIPFLFLFFICDFSSKVFSQSGTLVLEESEFSVSGGSSLHDWTAKVGDLSADIELSKGFFKKNGPKTGDAISKFDVAVEVMSMDGGRGKTMNDKIYKALKASSHPQVRFALTNAEVSGQKEGGYVLTALGELTMAGVTHSIEFEQLLATRKGDVYTFSGSKALKMTKFDIEPPSAMFGQIVVEDDVTINFNLKVQTNP